MSNQGEGAEFVILSCYGDAHALYVFDEGFQ